MVTGVKGAAADKSSGEKFSRYYRQPWDDGEMVVAQGRKSVVLGPAADASAIRGMVAEHGRRRRRRGETLRKQRREAPADVRTRKWVFMLQSPTVDDVFDYLGGDVKPLEADFLAFASPIYASNEMTGDLEPTTSGGTSRIVLDRTAEPVRPRQSTIRHEMVHALEHTWEKSFGGAPRWAVEGAAVALSDRRLLRADLPPQRGQSGYLRDHATLPTDKVFYLGDNDAVSSHYGVGYLPCAYLADKRGDAGLLKVLRALDDQPAAVERAPRDVGEEVRQGGARMGRLSRRLVVPALLGVLAARRRLRGQGRQGLRLRRSRRR